MMLENDNIEPAPDGDSEKPRGKGGGSLSLTERADRRLEYRAVRQRWPVSAAARREIVEHVVRDATDSELRPETRISAARVCLLMESQNQRDEHHRPDETIHHEHTVDVKALADRMDQTDGFAEFLADRACRSDTDPTLVHQKHLDAVTVGGAIPKTPLAGTIDAQ